MKYLSPVPNAFVFIAKSVRLQNNKHVHFYFEVGFKPPQTKTEANIMKKVPAGIQISSKDGPEKL